MKTKTIFIGAKNPEVIRSIHASEKAGQIKTIGFLDNDPQKKGKKFFGYPILGGFEKLPLYIHDNSFVNLITRDAITRFETSLAVIKAGGKFTSLIYPTINVEMTTIGNGAYLQEGVQIQADVRLGTNVSIHMGSLIGHECVIGNSVFIAHGCNLSGLITVEDGVFIGAGVTILPRIKIGKWSIIGAGAVVTKDVLPYSVVVGVPAKRIKTVVKKYSHCQF